MDTQNNYNTIIFKDGYFNKKKIIFTHDRTQHTATLQQGMQSNEPLAYRKQDNALQLCLDELHTPQVCKQK